MEEPEDKQESPDETQPPPQPPDPEDEAGAVDSDADGPAAEASRAETDGARRSARRLRPSVIILLGLCAAFGVGSYFAYPKFADEAIPGYSTIDVVSTFPIGIIDFSARPMSSDIVEVKVTLTQSELVAAPNGTTSATVYFAPSNEIPFTQCPRLAPCVQEVQNEPGVQIRHVIFAQQPGATATAIFLTKASGALPASNGLTASAALPQAFYSCPPSDRQCPAPTLETQYDLQSAASYDWSSVPYQHVSGSTITWGEQITGGAISGRVAVGINTANQSSADTWTFIAGALVGLAGGALIGAIQESLHPEK